MNTRLTALAALAIGAISVSSTAVAGQSTRQKLGRCTMAQPQAEATVEVTIPDASDFCELVSKALATDVFRAPVSVTSGRRWHYADAPLSCRLRYRKTRDRAVIHNSAAACRWFKQLAPGWHESA